ncbi:succinate dehydrogenase assembly factor 2, mitochondrial [Hyphopichia burtonii NRRL Y-1933]|uniref:Succinate dehydrogenase assembly factor 2, mitochondrial n=1 Tax=Hyphopichia burtonii NRRL Y-1933 TaxID=984485 RepID=A0A1E4RPE3_9ASCO|nr:succinate dehydrogenase assembly factor 2, mitochondrial [Hyphopichia burtonii NRRL Y-1933]ODV69081.1 succinate dehydrogenase assembly factor 2, mitochondrial [Hyphopichia burtonii NRRL Y-1933]
MLKNIVSKRGFSVCSRSLLNHGKPQNPVYNEGITMKIEPIQRTGETIDVKRARLVYQSRKRGILESDLLLSRFAKKYLNTFSDEELDEYDKLLDEPDWDIYYWATKNYDVTPLPEKWKNSKILALLQKTAQNEEREILRMPDLH